MNLMNWPWLCYHIDWGNVGGTYIMGFIGLSVCAVAVYACWHQIRNETN